MKNTKVDKKIIKRLRITVHSSNTNFFAQIIDDSGSVLVSANSLKITSDTKTKQAELVGKNLGEKAVSAKITYVYLDRGSKKYHGRINAFADAARKAGLIF